MQLSLAPRIAVALAIAFAALSSRAAPLPLRFEVNVGQADARAAFVARTPHHALLLAPGEAWIAIASDPVRVVHMRVEGASPQTDLRGERATGTRISYFRGADPAAWRRDVASFERVRARDIQPGVDLVYYGNEGELEFDFVAAPGAALDRIELRFAGSDAIEVAPGGDLALRVGGGVLALRAPVVYQEGQGGVREPVDGRFELRGRDVVGFRIGAHDPARPLVIDPVLSVATFLGGSLNDEGRAIATDAKGAIYVVGETISLDFPLAGPLQPGFGGGVQDIVVAKLDASGSKLVYATYLGGSLHDRGFAIAVDAYGGAVITGRTGSLDFPLVAPLQPVFGGGGDDAFATKLAPDGASLDFSTYLGGASNDRGLAIGVDAFGEIAIGGITLSANFPSVAAFQPSFGGGGGDGFVAKLRANGGALRFSSFVGGANTDNVRALALDAAGRIAICGDTSSADFPVAQPLQPSIGGGYDAWVGRVDPNGLALAPATFLGGSGDDFALGCDTTPAGEVVAGGITTSPDLPLVNPVQTAPAGGLDAYMTKLDTALATRVFSTYLGGGTTDFGLDVAFDPLGGAVLVGSTNSTDYPVQAAIQPANAGSFDTFATKLRANGVLEWSTYLGGSSDELAFDRMGVAIDGNGRPLITGITRSANHPLAVPVQPVYGGGDDAYMVRIGVAPEVRTSLSAEASGTRMRLALANGSAGTQQVELKIFIGPPGGASTIGLMPDPLLIALPPQDFTQLVDVVLPAAISFPGSKVGARLLDPITGAVRSESICRSVPCN